MRDRIWKPVLCALMAASLSICMFQGFNLDHHSISDNLPVTFLLSLVLELILTVFSYNRRSILTGIPVILGVAVVFFISLNVRGITIHDELSSPSVIYIYMIVLFITSVIVFLLGSSRAGTAVLFALGIYLIGGLKYLEFDSRVLYLILFVVSAMMEFAFLEYHNSAMESVLYRPDFTRFGMSSGALAAVTLGLAALMFFAVIVPFDPGAKNITLLTKHIAIENLKVTGIMDQYPVEDPNLHTDQTEETSQQQKEENENSEAKASSGDSALNAENDQAGESSLGSGQEEKGKAITYTRNINVPLLITILILLIAAASVLLKLLYRRLWLNHVRKKAPEEQIRILYLGLLKKFRRLGIERRPEDTPSVFATRNKRQLKLFASGKADFTRLTGLFLRVRYGQYRASQRDCRDFYKVYEDFYKHSRSYLGNLKYARKFFLL